VSKHAYLSIPAEFSVGTVNEMLRLGRENNFGMPTALDWRSDWQWCLCFEHGIVWSLDPQSRAFYLGTWGSY
jgi:hypothetical protein